MPDATTRAVPLRVLVRKASARVLFVPLTLVAGAGAGCAADTAVPTTSTTSREPVAPTQAPVGTVQVNDRTRLAGFKEVTVTVVAADGTSRTFCLMLADTYALRQQGLMFVTDPELGGYDGMVFAFEEDTDGGFWMKNTRLPLTIAYLRADGSTASITDMRPCPDDAATCPSYPSEGSYRYAIEVPQGELASLGVSDRSKVTLGETSCAPAVARSPAHS